MAIIGSKNKNETRKLIIINYLIKKKNNYGTNFFHYGCQILLIFLEKILILIPFNFVNNILRLATQNIRKNYIESANLTD